MTPDTSKKLKDYCTVLYILYPISIVCQFFESTLLFGVFLFLFSYTLNVAQKKRPSVKDTVFENHLRWLLRTFYISTGVLFPISMIAATYLVTKFTNIMSLGNMVDVTDTANLMSSIQNFMSGEMSKMAIISIATFAPVVLWCFIRYFSGYMQLRQDKPVENVTRWL